MKISVARSTEEAVTLSKADVFDRVTSDMDRPPDKEADDTLLAQLGPIHPPFVISSSSDDPRHDREAKGKGALGSTSSASLPFGLVTKAIAGSAP